MTLLFDLDGTLTDSKPGITRCIAHAMECMGRERPSEEELTWCVGPPIAHTFAQLLGGDDTEAVNRAVAHYRERFSTIGLFENAVYEGIPEVLELLQSRGVSLRVATSKPEVYAVRILEHFDLARYFDGIHGMSLAATRSEKTELIAEIIRHHRLARETTVMVGDRRFDVEGAHANGLRCIGVTYGYGGADELREIGADTIVDWPDEIPTALRQIGTGEKICGCLPGV